MDKQNWFDVKEIASGIYMVTEGERYRCFLLVGEERALLIDTGTGIADLSRLVRSITDAQVEVALTHGHWDHIGSAHLFQRVGIHPSDRELATSEPLPLMQERAQKFIKEWADAGMLFPPNFSAGDFRIKPCSISHELDQGQTINLGDTNVNVYHTPGHSPGSLSFLDEARGILFVGDAVKPREPQYAHLPGSDLDSYAASMELLASLAPDVKGICSCHTEPFHDSSILKEMAEGFAGAVSGKYTPHEVDTEWGRLREFSFDRFSIWIR